MPRTLVLLALGLGAACAGANSPSEPGDRASLIIENGIEYKATTRVMESFPVQIATTVTIRNTTGSATTLVFPNGYVVLLRAFRDNQQVWNQADVVGCTQALVEVELPAGASRSFDTRTDAREILGANLPNGRYRLEAVLQPSGGTVRLDAGMVDLAVNR